MSTKRSRVHPKYKTKYRVGNWPQYDRSLVERGNLTLWLSPAAISDWNAKPSGRRGGQQKYSDVAIEAALTLRLLFHLPLRQTEGFLLSIFKLRAPSLHRHYPASSVVRAPPPPAWARRQNLPDRRPQRSNSPRTRSRASTRSG